MVKLKPLSLIALVFVLLFSLAACSSGNNATPEASNSPSSSEGASPSAESSAPAATETASAPAVEETYDVRADFTDDLEHGVTVQAVDPRQVHAGYPMQTLARVEVRFVAMRCAAFLRR